MRVSKQKRAEVRRALVRAAVELFAADPGTSASMREVAARAGIPPATAYKYFPDRSQLFHAYFEFKAEDAAAALGRIEGFAGFSLHEKLQAFLEALLAEVLPEREFVSRALRGVLDAPLFALSAMQPMRRQVLTIVQGFVDDAVAEGSIPPSVYHGLWIGFFWDYLVLVVLYWLRDNSEAFTKTSELIDQSLDLLVTLPQSGFFDKAARIAGFLVKTHLHADLERWSELFAPLRPLHDDPRTPAREPGSS
ncbi:MAG: TetR family transcriptional regulator [Polyangiaceae bacterium]|nr:TetR family transcriptional regulator [Polyangiaceae bacterium]